MTKEMFMVKEEIFLKVVQIDVKRLRNKQIDICDQVRDLIIEVLEEKGE